MKHTHGGLEDPFPCYINGSVVGSMFIFQGKFCNDPLNLPKWHNHFLMIYIERNVANTNPVAHYPGNGNRHFPTGNASTNGKIFHCNVSLPECKLFF